MNRGRIRPPARRVGFRRDQPATRAACPIKRFSQAHGAREFSRQLWRVIDFPYRSVGIICVTAGQNCSDGISQSHPDRCWLREGGRQVRVAALGCRTRCFAMFVVIIRVTNGRLLRTFEDVSGVQGVASRKQQNRDGPEELNGSTECWHSPGLARASRPVNRRECPHVVNRCLPARDSFYAPP